MISSTEQHAAPTSRGPDVNRTIDVDDHVYEPWDGVDKPRDGAGRSRWLSRLLIGFLGVEAMIAVIALAIVVGVNSGDEGASISDNDPSITVPVAVTSLAPDDSAGFLRAWRRSRETDHAATGTLTRTTLGPAALYSSAWPDPNAEDPSQSVATWSYHHVHSEGRLMTSIGDVATVIDPGQGRLTCMQQAQSLVCSPVSGSDGDDSGQAVEQTVRGATATHRVEAIGIGAIVAGFPRLPSDIECWEARSRADGAGHRWGRRAQFCFHEPTGAAVFRRILGTTRVEVLVVEDVSAATNLGP